MNTISCEKILSAVKSDDLIGFSQLIKGNENLCFGRFPLLCVCYLFNAKKIIKKYEKTLGKISQYVIVYESFEIYQKFKIFAGRCLRLYLNNNIIISPLEMLAILHRDEKLKKCYKSFAKNIDICKNLTVIYQNIYGQSITLSKQKIKLGKYKFGYQQKKVFKIGAFSSFAFVCCIAICFVFMATFVGVGTGFSKSKIENANQFASALKSGGSYVLTKDFTLDSFDDLSVNFSGEIDGQNNTIYIKNFNGNSLILNSNSSIKNLNIVYDNLSKDVASSVNLLASKNYGTIENVNIKCSQLNLNCSKSQNNDIYISGFASENFGYIKNCKILLNANIVASGDGECYMSGFVGTNNGTVSSCEFVAGSEVSTTEVDLSGIVINNQENANISACKNYANLSQTSALQSWSPNASGIVQTNYGAVTNCFNYGKIMAQSNYEQTSQSVVFVGGIGAVNYGNISHCLNKGELIASSQGTTLYCGGISAYSSYWIKDEQMILPQLKSNGSDANINASTTNDKAIAFVGGISGFLWGEMNDCFSLCTFENGNNQTNIFVGTCLGSSYVQYQIFNSVICISASNNFMLAQDNVTYQIGSLINNGNIISTGQDSPNKEVTTLASKEQIQKQEIYWNDEN